MPDTKRPDAGHDAKRILEELADASRRIEELPPWRDELVWRARQAGIDWRDICEVGKVSRSVANVAYARHDALADRTPTHPHTPGTSRLER